MLFIIFLTTHISITIWWYLSQYMVIFIPIYGDIFYKIVKKDFKNRKKAIDREMLQSINDHYVDTIFPRLQGKRINLERINNLNMKKKEETKIISIYSSENEV